MAGVAVATALLAGVAAMGGLPALVDPGVDVVTRQHRIDREQAFALIRAVDLRPVERDEVPRAIAGMGLDEPAQRALAESLDVAAAQAPGGADALDRVPDASSQAANAAAVAAGSSAVPKARAQPRSVPRQARVALAWLTLWDSDQIDGDVVRVASDGYVRELTLARESVSFAIPVPRSGVVNLSGVRDGGGGITVGVMSGSSPVLLPILSEGQVLGIPVVAR